MRAIDRTIQRLYNKKERHTYICDTQEERRSRKDILPVIYILRQTSADRTMEESLPVVVPAPQPPQGGGGGSGGAGSAGGSAGSQCGAEDVPNDPGYICTRIRIPFY